MLNGATFWLGSDDLDLAGTAEFKTANVELDTTYAFEVMLADIETFDSPPNDWLQSFTLDLSSSSPHLRLFGWQTDVAFDNVADGILDTSLSNFSVSAAATGAIFGDPGDMVRLGSLSVQTTDVIPPGGEQLLVSLAGSTFVTGFGGNEALLTSFEDVELVLLDFGDAPENAALAGTFGTLAANDGPRHRIVDQISLGASVDPDADGQPTIEARGDDVSDDEDGITFLTPLLPGQQATIEVTSTGGFLWGWLDMNGNGQFDHPAERVLNGVGVGVNTQLSFAIDPAATATRYARFRFTTDLSADLTPLGGDIHGGVPDGEVEDYALIDFGDAPDLGIIGIYDTLRINDGASHFVDPQVFLGLGVDPDDDANESSDAAGDDATDVTDDEDGVVFNRPLVGGEQAKATVTASTSGNLHAWIDYNNDGDFNDPIDHVTAGGPFPLSPGTNVIEWLSPAGISAGATFARFRFTSAGVTAINTHFGLAEDGEVEDYRVQLYELLPEFGDAPLPYPTLLADNGALHLSEKGRQLTLGERVDFEADAQADDQAQGDDGHDGLDIPESNDGDDEDGVTFTSAIAAGQVATISVDVDLPVGIVSGLLNAWIDFNADGDWLDDGEQIVLNRNVGEGTTPLNVPVPAEATLGPTFARFRLSEAGGSTPDGPADGGEVEDYRIEIVEEDDGGSGGSGGSGGGNEIELRTLTIGAGAERQLSYFDADDTFVTITLRDRIATADVTFSGTGIETFFGRTGVFIDGLALALDQIDVMQSSTRTTLDLRARGGQADLIEVTINADNGLNALGGRAVNFDQSTITINGPMKKFSADRLTDTTLTIRNVGGDDTTTRVQFGDATNFDLTSDSSADVRGGSYLNDALAAGGISATYLKGARIKGDARFAAELTAVDRRGASVGNTTFGRFLGGTWTGPGDGGMFSAGLIDRWTADFGGAFRGIRSRSAISNSNVMMAAAGLIDARTDITQSVFTLTQAFNPNNARQVSVRQFRSRGAVTAVDLISQDNLGRIDAGRAEDFMVRAGVGDAVPADALPQDANDFANANRTSIGGVRIRGIRGENVAMRNVLMSAFEFGAITAARAANDTAGPFGFAGVNFRSFTYRDDDGTFRLGRDELATPDRYEINGANTQLVVDVLV